MSKRISYKVEGTVQGVNFRNWTVRQAASFKVTGWVKNADDGSVVGEAQGSDSAIDKFVQALHVGPKPADVSRVDSKDIAVKEGESGFNHEG